MNKCNWCAVVGTNKLMYVKHLHEICIILSIAVITNKLSYQQTYSLNVPLIFNLSQTIHKMSNLQAPRLFHLILLGVKNSKETCPATFQQSKLIVALSNRNFMLIRGYPNTESLP